MTNPFRQPESFWKVEFSFAFHMLPQLEEYFADITAAITSYELESKTVESMPTDLWCFEAMFEHVPDIDHMTDELKKILGSDCALKISKLDNIDWVAQMHDSFEPIVVGRFFITNPSQVFKCPGNKEVLIMESSRAFGTGEHNTTKGCIEAMEILSGKNISSIMDVGTGTGILAIAAAKIWPKSKIIGSDIEPVAVEISNQHAISNDVDIDFITIAGVPKYVNKVDLIISNILKQPLIELASHFAAALSDQGTVILSGFLDYQLQDVLNAYEEEGFKQTNLIEKGGWITISLQAAST